MFLLICDLRRVYKFKIYKICPKIASCHLVVRCSLIVVRELK